MVALVMVGIGAPTIPAGDVFTTLGAAAGVVAALSLVTSGAVLITRLPRNPIGWLLWAGGFLFTIVFGAFGLGGALVGGNIGAADWAFWLGGLAWVPAIVCVAVMVPLLFPTGHLPSQRWRAVVIVGSLR
ncbi:MAG: hypothetical protein ACRDF7_00075 [Candidatus Limnocylindrales bacterium]